MSDAHEKPFEATPQRVLKAKREGDVPRSAELGANLGFGAAGAAVVLTLPILAALARNAVADAASGTTPFLPAAGIVALSILPIACAALAGTAGSIVQAGGVHAAFPAPKFERLNPAEGIRRMLSRETFAHGVRASVAFGLTAALMVPSLRAAAVAMPARASIAAVASAAFAAAERVACVALAVGTAFALAEYAAARRGWLKKLRMSFEERKRELKEQEGDPFERSRRRALHRSLVRGSVADVKNASFVVVNPTHVAVALRYCPPEICVPTVLVRASGEMALRVRCAADCHGIPIVEDVALARALFRDASVGSPIDRVHFVAVAEVVAALLRAGLLDV